MSLLSVADAQAQILKSIRVLDEEDVGIEHAFGRCLSRDIVAVRSLPPWNNSAMDGYAVRVADVQAPQAVLKLAQTIFAGDLSSQPLASGTCARIMTGAPLPPEADAVVMQEHAVPLPDGMVRMSMAAHVGLNVRFRGEDIAESQRIASAGRSITIADAGVFWAQGLTRVWTHRLPTVSVVTNGDELSDVGSKNPLHIIDTNGPVIAALARQAGARAAHLGRAADSLEALQRLFADGLRSDVLVTVAGASVGERDFTKEAFKSLGITLDFWKVAMKPGKPLAFGRAGDTLVFGLPGNPVSAMVTFELFVRPALRALQGLPPFVTRLPARLAVPVQKAAGLRHFLRATWESHDGEIWATPVGTQSSGALSSAARATCLIELPEDTTSLEKTSCCELIPVSWSEPPPTNQV